MSRIANLPIPIPSDVNVTKDGPLLNINGVKGKLHIQIHKCIDVALEDSLIKISTLSNSKFAKSMAGTMRAIIQNMVTGVSVGFQKKLILQGVGYRAQVQGKILNLTLGFSHTINYKIPDEIDITTPSQTEIVIQGANKQVVGQTAAEIRQFRPPEPYKGKGIRYHDEYIIKKEAKKK